METADLKLDGNAMGGLLLELFGSEMTVAVSTCGSCGERAEIARLDVYVRCPGTVARCRRCDAVLMRVVEGRGRTWIDLSGTALLELPRTPRPG
jgi:Family of unknown function (DUF6510)